MPCAGDQQACPLPQQFFNTSSCKCECIDLHKQCLTGRQIFSSNECDCVCPEEKLKSQCALERKLFSQDKCDCVQIRRARATGAIPPPNPMAPPPPRGLCFLSVSNCTDMKVPNTTTCQCQCAQFLPAMDCPTPKPHTHSHRHRSHDHTHDHEYVLDVNGCPELTPKGKRYRMVRVPRRAKSQKTKKDKSRNTKKSKSSTPPEDTATILTPSDTCPEGQIPNFDTCECMRQQ